MVTITRAILYFTRVINFIETSKSIFGSTQPEIQMLTKEIFIVVWRRGPVTLNSVSKNTYSFVLNFWVFCFLRGLGTE
jgi:hypothetical protein